MVKVNNLHLTEADIIRYEEQIALTEPVNDGKIIDRVYTKMETMISKGELTDFETVLVADITKMVNILKQFPKITDDLKRRIYFALNYFVSEFDEIPDEIPGLGLLDDFVVVRWTLDTILNDDNKDLFA